MNKERRKVIADAAALLAEAQAKIDEAQEMLSDAADEERDYHDNMPEGLQAGERGQRADEVAGYLEEARDTLDTMSSDIGEVMSSLEAAGE